MKLLEISLHTLRWLKFTIWLVNFTTSRSMCKRTYSKPPQGKSLNWYGQLTKLIRYGEFVEFWHVPMLLTNLSFLKSLVSIHDMQHECDDHDYAGIETLLHDCIYKTAQRCAILPSRLHMHEVQNIPKTLVNGGGFADIYKGTLSDGRDVAMKVPRCFGKPDEIRRVHAVSCARSSW